MVCISKGTILSPSNDVTVPPITDPINCVLENIRLKQAVTGTAPCYERNSLSTLNFVQPRNLKFEQTNSTSSAINKRSPIVSSVNGQLLDFSATLDPNRHVNIFWYKEIVSSIHFETALCLLRQKHLIETDDLQQLRDVTNQSDKTSAGAEGLFV